MSAKPAEPRAPHNLSSSHSWTTRLVPISTSLMRLAQNADPILPRIQPACDTSSRYTSRTRKRRPDKRTRHTCRCLMFSLSSSTRLRAQRSVISRFVSAFSSAQCQFFRLRPYILLCRFMITRRTHAHLSPLFFFIGRRRSRDLRRRRTGPQSTRARVHAERAGAEYAAGRRPHVHPPERTQEGLKALGTLPASVRLCTPRS